MTNRQIEDALCHWKTTATYSWFAYQNAPFREAFKARSFEVREKINKRIARRTK